MNSLMQKVIKSAAISFAVGALLALAVPPLATMVGIQLASVGVMANPMWLGAFFGTWGAINAVVEPAMNHILGKHRSQPPQAENLMPPAEARAPSKQVNIIVVPQHASLQESAQPAHRQRLETERLLASDSKSIH
jgi:hypothetical protein